MKPKNVRKDISPFARRCSPRSRILLAVVIAGAVVRLTPATTAFAFQVCARNCAPADAGCLAEIAACETKIHAYNLYMEQMGAGVTRHQLPAVYRYILRSRYPLADFNAYRFGFSDRQPPNNATTDCLTTYFNHRDYVDSLRAGGANPNWSWLLHEVTHAEQCASGGGRESYARRWWDEMETALAARGRTVDFTQPPQELANQMGALFLQVHDAMPMERTADAKAGTVRAELRRCCIDRDGKPVLPLNAISIEDRLDAGSSRHILAAKVENGDPPFTTRWRIRNPGEPGFIDQPQNLIHGLELLWTPKKDPGKAEVVESQLDTRLRWRYEIEVEITQQNPALDKIKLSKTIVLSERQTIKKPATGVQTVPKLPTPPPPSSVPGSTLPGPVKPPIPAPGPLPSKPSTLQ
jgi:hypothetical protein